MFSGDNVHSPSDIKTMLSYLIGEIWCHRKILFPDRRETKCHQGETPEGPCWMFYQHQMETVNTYSVARPRILVLEGPCSHIN